MENWILIPAALLICVIDLRKPHFCVSISFCQKGLYDEEDTEIYGDRDPESNPRGASRVDRLEAERQRTRTMTVVSGTKRKLMSKHR